MVINPLLHAMILQVIYSTQVVLDGVKTPINGRKWICNCGYFTLLIGVITPFTLGLWKTHLVRTSKKRDPPTMRKFVQCWYWGMICEAKHLFPKVWDFLIEISPKPTSSKAATTRWNFATFCVNICGDLVIAIAEMSSAYDRAIRSGHVWSAISRITPIISYNAVKSDHWQRATLY